MCVAITYVTPPLADIITRVIRGKFRVGLEEEYQDPPMYLELARREIAQAHLRAFDLTLS